MLENKIRYKELYINDIIDGVFMIADSYPYLEDGELDEIVYDIEKYAGKNLSADSIEKLRNIEKENIVDRICKNNLMLNQRKNIDLLVKGKTVSKKILTKDMQLAIDVFDIAHFGYNHLKNKNAFYSLNSKVFFVKKLLKNIKPAGYLDKDRRIPYVRVAGHDNLIYAYTLGTVLDIRNIKKSKDYSGKQFNSYDFTEYELLHE